MWGVDVHIVAKAMSGGTPFKLIHLRRWTLCLGIFIKVKEEIDKKKPNGMGLDELIDIDMAVRSLKDKIEKSLSAKKFHDLSDIRKSAELLRKSVVALDSSLSSLEVHVEDMFKVLVTSRNVLLDIYSRLVVLSPFLSNMS